MNADWSTTELAKRCSELMTSIVVLVSFSVCIAPMPAYAKGFSPFGDRGDVQTSVSCPTHQFLVGLRVRVGDWMDQMGLICAPTDFNGNTGPQSFSNQMGGEGGAPPVNVTCQPGEVMFGVALLMTPQNRQVRLLKFNCISRKRPTNEFIDIGNKTHGEPSKPVQNCFSGEAITGFNINYGKHVNALGIICGALPELAPPQR